MIVSTSPQQPDRVVAEFAATTPTSVAAAAQRARAAQPDWAHSGPAARAAALAAAADAVDRA
ncbi:MAG TPA: aldehyde dehydrogenase family protein, partial [Jatrophihabitans sp.]|nr:aldehyde dehydrogenase family protein [Jatrophihabitans sp.]